MNSKDQIEFDRLLIEEQQLKNELLKLEVLHRKQQIQQHKSVWGGIGVLNNNHSHLDTYPKVMFNGPSDHPLGNQVTSLDCFVVDAM